MVFHLYPRPTPPRNVLENYWLETPLYTFQGLDGDSPLGDLAMDQSGDLYGSTSGGGSRYPGGNGVAFELTPSNGGWSESILYNFPDVSDGLGPNGVTLDAVGNIYGTTSNGGSGNCGNGCGTVYQLLAGSGWMHNILYNFTGGSDGGNPESGVTLDPSGNLYSSTFNGGSGGGGTAFELSSGSWSFQLLYSLMGNGNGSGGPVLSNLIFDQEGNLYGTTQFEGAVGGGSVFKLTPSMGGYIYTSLHAFCAESPVIFACPDGVFPIGTLVMDSSGNLYGTATQGGSNSGVCNTGGSFGACGVIFKITP